MIQLEIKSSQISDRKCDSCSNPVQHAIRFRLYPLDKISTLCSTCSAQLAQGLVNNIEEIQKKYSDNLIPTQK